MLMALAISFTSCGDTDPEESCDGEDIAEDLGCPVDVSIVATFCSDGETNSYYTYDGNNYDCTGVEASTCDDAIAAIGVQVLIDNPDCVTKKSADYDAGKAKLSALAQNLLNEVRLQSLCN